MATRYISPTYITANPTIFAPTVVAPTAVAAVTVTDKHLKIDMNDAPPRVN